MPIEEIRLASLREQIAMVSQDVVLFNDTIGNNIGYGARRATQAASTPAERRAAIRDAAVIEAYLGAPIEHGAINE